ncbi:BON domain-containing protein [Streptomyces sp. Amel2xB2]|uniref:CBS domain-containing protein n=1 Tax=Streptomyces sp. Amel2xB2 TaxID=1305829 RepID=UPI000DBA2E24|nr:BON domain-containing protein [Streptomyces sp. Amel2xB2]
MAHRGDVRDGDRRAAGAHRQDRADGASLRAVADVMTHTVVAVGRQATFKDVAENMHEWRVSGMPVVEADGRVIGVVTEADLLAKEEYRDGVPNLNEPRERMERLLKSGALTAGEMMSTPAVSVHQDARVTEAARIMAWKGVKRLPVVDGAGRLVGIVSRSDLLKVFLRSDEEIAEEIRQEVLGLLPDAAPTLRVQVDEGLATVRGTLDDRSLVPVAARLIRSVEGVVDVDFDLD